MRKKSIQPFSVATVDDAKSIASEWLAEHGYKETVTCGSPEVDDRYNIWRVSLISAVNSSRVGEIAIDAATALIDQLKTTKPEVIDGRLLQSIKARETTRHNEKYQMSELRNIIAMGDAEVVLQELPNDSIDLIFTSPPYFNVRPEYSDYINYEEYLLKMRKIIQKCHLVLNEGRFFVINTSPVLIRRASRSQSSKRIAIPFDLHRIFTEEGFDFIDDIVWVKPEGAGWATGRGRRFAADRNPLQYKPVPVTEYIMVYRKKTDKLIDWNIKTHPDKNAVEISKIKDPYERTNLWRITPSFDKKHPAVFPLELAEKIIKYYSFNNDVVLDPFSGVGTTAKAAVANDRRFVAIEINPKYIDELKRRAKDWLGEEYENINFLNCKPDQDGQLTLI